LLLLRVAVGFTAAAQGVFCFSGPSPPSLVRLIVAVVLVASGTALTIGFLTPFAGILVALCFLGMFSSSIPAFPWGLHDAKLLALEMIIAAAALVLLGPGTYSLDGRLFGRREIVIPPSSRAPQA
jgi:uncharacterized membrane protein YphA (DoxX/SURF4 family)